MTGKDGKPFDKQRWVEWAIRGTSSFTVNREQQAAVRERSHRVKRFVCPKCFGVFIGRGIRKHRDEGCQR